MTNSRNNHDSNNSEPKRNSVEFPCQIYNSKLVGVMVNRGGKGTFNENTVKDNYFMGMELENWVISDDAGDVKGSGNSPELPGK